MAGLSVRDRFFTPRVARAITSPSGLALMVAGVALGLIVGLPIPFAVLLGVGAWSLRVAAAMAPQPPAERIDPFTVNEPWRGFVQDALAARSRFRAAVERTRSGPLQDTLSDIAGRLDTGVQECWRIARQGESLVRSRRDIDTRAIDRELAQAETAAAADPGDRVSSQTVEALRTQRATADRMDGIIDSTRSELRLLDARMGEAVVRAIELSAQASAPDLALGLSSDVDGVVSDLEALRLALEETAGGPNPGPAPG